MILEFMIALGIGISGSDELKCLRSHALPGWSSDRPVVLLDGVVMEDADLSLEGVVPAESVMGVEVTCWNPDTDELPAMNGVQLIMVWTKEDTEARQAEVTKVVDALLAFSAAQERMPGRLDEMAGVSEVDRFVYQSSAEGWSVSNEAMPVAYRCTAKGTAEAEARPEVDCWRSYDLARQNLRRRYGSGSATQ